MFQQTNQLFLLWIYVSLRLSSGSWIWSCQQLWLTRASSLPLSPECQGTVRDSLAAPHVPIRMRAHPRDSASCSPSFPTAQKETRAWGEVLVSAPSDEIPEGLTQQLWGLDTTDPLFGRVLFPQDPFLPLMGFQIHPFKLLWKLLGLY